MFKLIYVLLFAIFINLSSSLAQNNAVAFTQEDRARIIRTEIKVEELEKRMIENFQQVDKRFEQVDKRFEQVDKRFEQVDKRFEEMLTYMGWMIALFGSMFVAIISFAFWDRRTMI